MADEIETGITEAGGEEALAENETELIAEPEQEAGEAGGEGELIIEIEGAAPARGESESDVIRQLRERHREMARELARLRKTEEPQKEEPGPRPALADFDYDEDRHTEAVLEWGERRKAVEQAKHAAKSEYQQRLEAYRAEKTNLGFADMEAAEAAVIGALSIEQQNALLKIAEKPALLVYSLHRHPDRLDALADITDPAKLIAEIVRLEGRIKMTRRQSAPEPERVVTGSASVAATVDKTEQKLEQEAARTNDYTKLFNYRREKARRT